MSSHQPWAPPVKLITQHVRTRERGATYIEHLAQLRRTQFRVLPQLEHPVLTQRIDESRYPRDDAQSQWEIPTQLSRVATWGAGMK